MKNNLLRAVLLVFTISAFAQTPEQKQKIIANYDLEKLSALELRFEENFNEERQRAVELAEVNGWPISYETEDGGQAILVRVLEDGKTPIYYKTDNHGASITARANRINTGGSAGLELDGENMFVGIWDGGRVRESHELFEGRAEQQDGSSQISWHATHVAGTVIGSDDESFEDGDARGMAPSGSTLNYDFNNDMAELTAEAASGLLVSNHSYGVPADGGNGNPLPSWYLGKYDSSARDWDELLYNAPYLVAVKSAGNARDTNHDNQDDGGYDILTGDANAKNNMVVAANWQVTNYNGPSSVVMSSFSSWGPTDDGRIKPDISAKGVQLTSSTSENDAAYGISSGTSMSAPSVAGVLILLQEHYNDLNNEFMLASTLKGLAIHTADEAGVYPGPDYRFGWGLINAERGAEVITNNGTSSLIIEETLEENDVYTTTVNATELEDFMGSISWTDLPGSPAGSLEDLDNPRLKNDLDLRLVHTDGTENYPWILDHTDFSAAAEKGDNYRDNVEKVEIEDADGEYIVRVSHKEFEGPEQVFSLILSGIEIEENYMLSSHQGVQEICNTEDEVVFDIDMAVNEDFSGTVDFTVADEPSGATVALSDNSLSGEGTTTLTVSDLEGLPGGDYLIKVTGTNDTEEVNLYVLLRILGDDFTDVTLVSPEDNALETPIDLYLEWETPDAFADEFDIEIATDAAFDNIVETATVSETIYQAEDLEEFTEYYWRVAPKNACAIGVFSEEFRFETGDTLDTEEFENEDISLYPNPTSDYLNIQATSTIHNVEIVNMLGQNMGTYTPTANNVQLDMSAFAAGTYIVKVTIDDASNSYQIIKK